MKHPKNIVLIILLFFFLTGYSQQFYLIPRHIFNPYEVLGYNRSEEKEVTYTIKVKKANFTMKVDSLEISHQITLGQYKEYLNAIKKDSSNSFYLSQFPDSTITSKENYIKYITDKKYDNFPAAGITWEAAMNYCKWKTLQDNKNEKISYIYRLPQYSDWLCAYDYLESNGYENDFSKNYSDWTMGLYYEAGYSMSDSPFVYDMHYLPRKKDHPRDKRMRVIGNSYLFQRENLIQYGGAYFTFSGYRQVAFRMVKEQLNKKKIFTNNIIKYWGLTNTD